MKTVTCTAPVNIAVIKYCKYRSFIIRDNYIKIVTLEGYALVCR